MTGPTAPEAMDPDELAKVVANNRSVMHRYMEGLSSTPPPAERIDPPAVRVVRDIAYDSAGPSAVLHLDLYLPEPAAAPAPVVVWLPGGGWRNQRRGMGPRLTRLFAERGYAMADIEYRSSELSPWPAQLHDVLAALRRVRSLADEYRLDAGAIGLWGSSAGAHLALSTAFAASAEGTHQLPGIRAVVAGYPPTDLPCLNDDALPGGVLAVDATDPSWGLLGGPPAERTEAAAHASPTQQVHAAVPPVLLLHGDADVLIGPGQSRRLYDALLAAGTEAHLLLVHGENHGFFNFGDWELGPKAATLLTSRAPGVERTAVLTPALVERFFDRHLRSDPWNA
ncbi:alpha/beta hydrolase fold domain-containing protein [Streptomyces sp. NPDC001843]|uniref:alpha/beta hydrolase fold domain-containing protein n=1 Tax=Streptomyces sp. NPDC001843 TaxID=3364617 RepID=UPI00367540E2